MKDNLKNIWLGIISSAYFTLIIQIYSYIKPIYGDVTTGVAIFIITFIIFFGLTSINRYFIKFKFYRNLTIKNSVYEGEWLLKINTSEDDAYGIARLEYDEKEKSFMYEGKTFDSNYKLLSTFYTENLFFCEKHEILYNYYAENLVTGRAAHGIGYLKFSDYRGGKFRQIIDKFYSLTGQNFSSFTCELTPIKNVLLENVKDLGDSEKLKKILSEIE